jgi:predicted DNA-binding protein with PD1-like motif
MKIILDSKEKTILKLEKGEELIESLVSISSQRDMSSDFSLIGGCSYVELAYYDMDQKKYLTKVFENKNIEVLPCRGNIAWFESRPIVHVHGVFSGPDYNCFGGHIMKLIISITGEVIINWLPEKIERQEVGGCLKLLINNENEEA